MANFLNIAQNSLCITKSNPLEDNTQKPSRAYGYITHIHDQTTNHVAQNNPSFSTNSNCLSNNVTHASARDIKAKKKINTITEHLHLQLNNGININALKIKGISALHYATKNKLHTIVKMLIEYGADINFTDSYGSSALLLACENGFIKIVELLINYGADLNLINKDTYTALHLTCKNGHFTIAKQLLQINLGANINFTDIYGSTALHLACENNHFEIVELLINRNADLNLKTMDGSTALFLACKLNNEKVASILIKKGANIFLDNALENTALHAACQYNNTKIVAELLENGADVNIPNHQGKIPLHLVCQTNTTENEEENTEENKIAVVAELIKYRVDVNIKDNLGKTPLSYTNNFEIYELLVSQGADITLMLEDGFILTFKNHNNLPKIICMFLDIKLKKNNDYTLLSDKVYEFLTATVNLAYLFKSVLKETSNTKENDQYTSYECTNQKFINRYLIHLLRYIGFIKETKHITLVKKIFGYDPCNTNLKDIVSCKIMKLTEKKMTESFKFCMMHRNYTQFFSSEIHDTLSLAIPKSALRNINSNEPQLTRSTIISEYFDNMSINDLKEIAKSLDSEILFSMLLDILNINIRHKILITKLRNDPQLYDVFKEYIHLLPQDVYIL